MSERNDMYVGDNCSIAVHCRGHVFTIAELFNIAQLHSTKESWDAHDEDNMR